jgi:hypothetical protein
MPDPIALNGIAPQNRAATEGGPYYMVSRDALRGGPAPLDQPPTSPQNQPTITSVVEPPSEPTGSLGSGTGIR